MNDISIIIISYNTKELTKKCLESIIKSIQYAPNLRTEIIVVDNNSTDGSVKMLAQMQMSKIKKQNENVKFKIIYNTTNTGFSKGNNQAIKQATSNILLFLNSDIDVLEDAIPQLYKYFINQDQFQFVGGKLLNQDQTPQASCGPFYSLPVIFAALFLRGDYFGLTRYSPNTIRGVDWVSGACFICKKSDFEFISGFDEKIFMYMDEIDLFFRAKKHGLKVGFYPKSRFIHLGSGSSQGRTQPILQVYKGFIYFYKKHHNNKKINLLKIMLKLKARLAYWLGKAAGNQYLINTYAEAEKIVDAN